MGADRRSELAGGDLIKFPRPGSGLPGLTLLACFKLCYGISKSRARSLNRFILCAVQAGKRKHAGVKYLAPLEKALRLGRDDQKSPVSPPPPPAPVTVPA